MARSQWRLAALLGALPGLPLLWTASVAAGAALAPAAWRDLLTDPQTFRALGLSLFTGLLASGLALALAAWMLSLHFPGPTWSPLLRALNPMLAMPHAALAIGVAFLLAPSGWLLRALSPWATGLDAPPHWRSTQDPWGLGLVLVLLIKEVPFLLWAAATQLQRADLAERWSHELWLARSMGYGARVAWWRVLWPQLWPRLRWPVLAVLAYSLTVVDMALVIGPGSPPTLAVLAWQWLLDADPARNAQGAAAAWLLALLAAALAWLATRPLPAPWARQRWTGGERGNAGAQRCWPAARAIGFYALALIYLAAMLALALGSVAGLWPFPALLPQTFTAQAWATVTASSATLNSSLTLALASALAALLWSLAWLEYAPARWIVLMRQAIYLPLLLPPVLWIVGLHGMSLRLGLDGRWSGVWLAHTLAALPYVLIALEPAYSGFDARYGQVSASLGQGRMAFLWRVKWPLLRAALASAFAVGFAVSMAQYLPTLFIGAGRITTVTTEAITQATSAQRALTAAYAWLQWLLPALVFGLAAWLGRTRRLRGGDASAY